MRKTTLENKKVVPINLEDGHKMRPGEKVPPGWEIVHLGICGKDRYLFKKMTLEERIKIHKNMEEFFRGSEKIDTSKWEFSEGF